MKSGDQRRDMTVNVVRHFERVPVRHAAFDRVAREQRRLRCAAHDEGELPGDVGRVHERRVDPLPAKGTRHVARVAEEKSAAVAKALGLAPMHLEIGDPAEVVQADARAGPCVDGRRELGFGRRSGRADHPDRG